MTPRNPLDDKAIVDRQKLQMIVNALQKIHEEEASDGYPLHPEMRAFMDHFKQALAQDLAGWAAVPVNFNLKMYYAGAEEKTVRETYRAMLKASPPLPGGGE